MKRFLAIILFSKSILLTPSPVDLFGSIELVPDKPINAITTGAGIEIDVSSMIEWKDQEDIKIFENRLLSMFPPGRVSANLIGKNVELPMYYDGGYSVNKNSVILYVDAKNGVPVGVDYNKVIVHSSINLKNIKILWRNYKY